MNTKSLLYPVSERKHYFYLTVAHFSKYIVKVPTPENHAQYVVYAISYEWIPIFGPPQFLIRDGATEYLQPEMVNCCTLNIIRHSPKTEHAPWTNRLIEKQKKTWNPSEKFPT